MSPVTGHLCAVTWLLGVPCVVGAQQPDARPTWPVTQVRYYVNPVNSDLSPAAATAALQAGALAWGSQAQANFSFFYAGETSGTSTTYNLKNEVIFRNDSEGDSIATAYTWSQAGTIVDVDIIFWDGAFEYFTGSTGCSDGFFVEDIAAHEFGHGAGLSHSDVPGSTMFATVDRCSTSARSLGPDDLDRIEALYPPNGITRPPSPPVGLTAYPSPGRTASSVDLSWTDMSSDEDVFVVERSADGVVFVAVGQTPADMTRFVDLPLASNALYWYRVVARNAGGHRGGSNVVSVHTTRGPPPPEPPTSPTPASGLGGVSLDTVLSWRPGSTTQSYDIYFGTTDPPPPYARGVTTTALSVRGLSATTTYYWSVFANNEGGSSTAYPWRFTTTATTTDTAAARGADKGLDSGWEKPYTPR